VSRAAAVFFALYLLAVFALHFPYVDLPYYWDELGQFIPQALDLYQKGLWIPESTLPNVHPPGVPALIALAWKLSGGPSIVTTRCLMLLLAGCTVWFTFQLAVELLGDLPGAPAFTAVVLLLASPLFYMQSMMANLDQAATLGAVAAFCCHAQGRIRASAIACALAVCCKETAIAAPLVLWCFTRQWVYLAACTPLAGWIVFLYVQTGHPLGEAGFAAYNFWHNLHPVRLLTALLRRLWTLGFDQFHWIGLAMVWRYRHGLRHARWRPALTFAAAHLLLVSLFGGAVLERYLLPLWPIWFCLVAAGIAQLPSRLRRWVILAQALGLFAGLFWRPPYPYPLENNLAMVDQIRLFQQAAQVANRLPGDRLIVTQWPLADALRRPEFGYVSRPHPVRTTLTPEADLLIAYSRDWHPAHSWMRWPWVRGFWTRWFGYQPPVPAEAPPNSSASVRFERNAEWIEIYPLRSGIQ
jgi:hypothetical protein